MDFVYIIDPCLTMHDTSIADRFCRYLENNIRNYIPLCYVSNTNIACFQHSLSKASLIVVFNGDLKSDLVRQFIECARQNKAQIFPIAINKSNRKPVEYISEIQSYDVYEQLRLRDLSDKYTELVASDFARNIISAVMPTIYSNQGSIFISHRRIDGEDIAARLCDKIKQQSSETKIFRDVTEVKVGEQAQLKIDEAMVKTDAFIFLHTPKASESNWIKKELSFAILRRIPIVWVQIDRADSLDISIRPSERPNLSYSSTDFTDEKKLSKIADEILEEVFKVCAAKTNDVYQSINTCVNLLGDRISKVNGENLIYKITVERNNYHYPQRPIIQYIQFFGKNPDKSNIEKCRNIIKETIYDNLTIISNRYLSKDIQGNIAYDSFENFYDHWYSYLNGKEGTCEKEIIISGAFPNSDEIHKQCLTDALIIFAKNIIKNGYKLTFGSHPSFQELFFEIAKEVVGEKEADKVINMFISKWFENKYNVNKEYFKTRATLYESQCLDSISTSLTQMRKDMIQRKNVAALVCLGGMLKDNKKEEGVREEVQIAREAGVPVFVVGSVGGCSSVIASEYLNKWNELNNAPEKINLDFMYSLDYFYVASEMLDWLKHYSE